MKKAFSFAAPLRGFATLFTSLISLIPTAALAAKGYIGSDGYLYITDLEPRTQYEVKLGGMPVVRAGYANSCGILRIRASAIYKDSDRFEIEDEGTNKKYALEYSKLATGDTLPRCNGEVVSGSKAWKSADGRTIFMTGLTPGRGQTIRILSEDIVRRLTTNFCGYFRFKLDENPPAAIIVDGEAFPTNTTATGRGLACRSAQKYVSFPPPPEVVKESEEQWKQENPVPFSDGATVVDSSGATGTTNTLRNQNTFTLPQPEPNFYLVNGALVIANRPDNGEILGSLQIEPEDYSKLAIFGSAGPAACGRQQLNNSNSFTEPYTTKKNIRVDYWAEVYLPKNKGWRYVTIPAGTTLQNFPYGYSCN